MNSEKKAAEDTVAMAARALVKAAGIEAFGAEAIVQSEREQILKEVRRWLDVGLSPTSDDKTEDACARKILKILGEKR
jgi:hypothetical protein